MHRPSSLDRGTGSLCSSVLVLMCALGCKSGGGEKPRPPDMTPPSGAARACAEEPIKTTGSVYYACDCQFGADPKCAANNTGASDANDGTSPDRPWRTWEKLMDKFGSIAAGDTVAFCRGGRFQATSDGRWSNYNCRASDPCIIRDYAPPWGDGTEARPVLVSSGGGSLFDFENGGEPHHREGYRLLNLEAHGEASGASWGVFVYNDIDDVTLCNMVFDGFDIAVHVEGSNPPGPDSDGKNQRIALLGSRILNSSKMGWLGACDGCTIADNYFANNGSGDMLLHSIYLSGMTDGTGATYTTTGERVTNNEIHAGWNGNCAGVVLVVHGQHQDLLIEGNLVEAGVGVGQGGCYGIALDSGGYSTPGWFRDAVIRRNTIRNTGNTALGVEACRNCLIEDNLVIHEHPYDAVGISVPLYAHRTSPLDDTTTNSTVWNNTIYFGPAASGTGIRLGIEGTGHVLASNAVYYAGAGPDWSCFDLDPAQASYSGVDYNLCWFPNAPAGKWENQAGNLEAWRTAQPGFDAHSLQQDPMFVNGTTAPYDFTPSDGSPLVGHADPTQSSPIDITGKTRDQARDIGAYER